MCVDPITLLTIAGTAVSAGGAMMAGQQEQQMANMQAKAYEQQRLAEQQASAFEVKKERRQQELQAASARAQVGASGVGFQGSPTEVLAANARTDELDLAAIRYGSQLRQNGLQTQADISRYSGRQSKTAGYIAGASALTSGMKSVKFGGSIFADPFKNI